MDESETGYKKCSYCYISVNQKARVCPSCQRPLDNPGLELVMNTVRGIVFSTVGAVLLGIISNVLYSYLKPYISDVYSISNPIRTVHWSVWICIFPVIYSILCYLNDKRINRHTSFPFTVPTWTQLKAFGDKRVARISYYALVIIPFAAYLVSSNPFKIEVLDNLSVPLSLKLAFFTSWFFSISLFLFTIGKPKLMKEEQSTEFLDTVYDDTNPELRAIIYLFYTLGISVAFIIFCRSAWVVVNS